MELSVTVLWWVAAGLVVVAELATGTFYLLMIALGLAGGAIASHLGLPMPAQIVVAALVGGGATALWHWKRYKNPTTLPARENRDVNLDIGELVQVMQWSADGTTRVQYRGAQWTARRAPGVAEQAGLHAVTAVEGNWLVLSPAPSATAPVPTSSF